MLERQLNMKNSNYISSITTKYGDIDNVKADVKALNDIISRQGTSLLIDTISNSVGDTVNKYKLESTEAQRIVKALVTELKESLLERV